MIHRIAVIGAGGFAREVKWLLNEINIKIPTYDFRGFIVSDRSRLTSRDSQNEVLGDFDWLEKHCHEIDCLALGIGSPNAKRLLTEQLLKRFPALDWPCLIHPSAQFEKKSAEMGRGVVVCASTVGTVGLAFSDFAMVNLQCTLGHECIIGPYAVLNPSVNISGGVEIGSGVLVGTGAQILQYVKVGDNAIVGAGAVVVKDVQPGQTVVGIPAKPRD